MKYQVLIMEGLRTASPSRLAFLRGYFRLCRLCSRVKVGRTCCLLIKISEDLCHCWRGTGDECGYRIDEVAKNRDAQSSGN